MKRKLLYFIISACLAIVLVGSVAAFLVYRKINVVPNLAVTIKTELSPTATPTPDPLAAYSILLMGYGGGYHEGGLLTDSMMVVRIEPHNQNISMISIPRDLWVTIPKSIEATISSKINAAFAIGSDDKKYPDKAVEYTGEAGGGELAKAVVENVVGFKIDKFVALDFSGFVKIIDILGGIKVNVQRTFDDPWYPIESNIGVGNTDACGKSEEEIVALTATMSGDKLEQEFTCRYDPLHFDKGLQQMDGTLALKYARSRHSPIEGGDFNRAARQRQVIIAVKDKVLNIGFLTKVIPTIETLSRNISTDVDLLKMNEMLNNAGEISEYKISPIALTDQNVFKNAVSSGGQFILIPKGGENSWEDVWRFIADPTILTPTVTPAPVKTLD